MMCFPAGLCYLAQPRVLLCYFCMSRLFLTRSHCFGHLVDESDVTVVDSNLLRRVPVVTLCPFSYLHPLDEGVQGLAGQLWDLCVLLRVLQEAADVSGGVLQLLELLRHLRKCLINISLLLCVVAREQPILLVRDATENGIFIQPFENCRQFRFSPFHLCSFLLECRNLPLGLLALLYADILGEAKLVLPCEVGDPANIVQQHRRHLYLSDIMSRANFLALFLVGGAHEVVLDRIHRVRPVEHHRSAAVGTVHQTGEHILLCKLGPAPFVLSDVLHDLPGLLVHQRLVGVLET